MDCSKRLTPGALQMPARTSIVYRHAALTRVGRWDESHGGDIGAMAIPNHGAMAARSAVMELMANSVPVLPKRRDESEGGGNKGRAQLPR